MYFHEVMERRVPLMRTPMLAARRSKPRRTRRLRLLAAAIGLTLLTGCGSNGAAPTSEVSSPPPSAAFPVTVVNCGTAVTVTKAPTRAVTMNQGATETLLALGLQDSMVGTAYLDDAVSPSWQAAYATIPVLAKEYPNQEKLLAANPDLVAASYASAFDAKAAGTRADLSALGIATYVSPFACEDKATRAKPTWDAIFGEVTDLATLFGDPARATSVIEQQKAEVAEVSAAAPAKGKTVLWYDSGTKTPFVGAGQGAPQLMIDALGGTNMFASLTGNWADGSWETVLKTDPDVIVLADASWDTAAQKKTYLKSDRALKDLTAVKNDAFVVVPFSATTPGVRNAEGVRSLASQLAALQ